MNYGLKPETISEIQSILETVPEVKKAVLYGSRAMGKQRPGSDIDLTLEGESLNLDHLTTLNSRNLHIAHLFPFTG